jgi:lipid-A-disaccharide synthase-like uncharacterized protein
VTFSRPRLRLLAAIAAAVLLPAVAWWVCYRLDLAPAPGQPLRGAFNLSDRLDRLQVRETPDGGAEVVFPAGPDGSGPVTYDADAFLREVKARQEGKRRWGGLFAVLDITSWTGVFWVGFGLIGQGLFAARMLVQWIASEKAQASVIPVAFWWLSLVGSSMIIIYFIWRVEIVGILGQSTGWFVYVRNLWFIHSAGVAHHAAPRTDPEGEEAGAPSSP